uniref:Uncharacterized protein n=1 Tax=Cacopsylla melanoneura TaxID=428564 RepID=A0A8D8SWD0_9HEMI
MNFVFLRECVGVMVQGYYSGMYSLTVLGKWFKKPFKKGLSFLHFAPQHKNQKLFLLFFNVLPVSSEALLQLILLNTDLPHFFLEVSDLQGWIASPTLWPLSYRGRVYMSCGSHIYLVLVSEDYT